MASQAATNIENRLKGCGLKCTHADRRKTDYGNIL